MVARRAFAPFLTNPVAIWKQSQHAEAEAQYRLFSGCTIFPIPLEPPVIKTTFPLTPNRFAASRELILVRRETFTLYRGEPRVWQCKRIARPDLLIYYIIIAIDSQLTNSGFCRVQLSVVTGEASNPKETQTVSNRINQSTNRNAHYLACVSSGQANIHLLHMRQPHPRPKIPTYMIM